MGGLPGISLHADSLSGWRRRALTVLARAIVVMLMSSALLVTMRLASVRLDRNLPGSILLIVASVGSLLVMAVDATNTRGIGTASWLARVGLAWLMATLVLLCRTGGVVWPALLVTATVASLPLARWLPARYRSRAGGGERSATPRAADESPQSDEAGGAQRPTPCETDARVVQWFERRDTGGPAAGDEDLRGRLTIRVAAGCRTASGHVGFCPPLARSPQVYLSVGSDDVEASIDATEIRPWGMRIECRLETAASEALEIPVDWHATARS